MTDKIYYVYMLLDPTNLLPFYIGKGKNSRYTAHFEKNQLKRKSLKNSKIKSIQNKGNSVIVSFYILNISEETANICESALIAKYGRIDNGTGILCNHTNGGEGVSGYTVNIEERDRRSTRMLGKVACVDSLGNNMIIDKSQFEHSEFVGIAHNFVAIKGVGRITKQEFNTNKEKYKHHATGKVTVKDNMGNIMSVSTTDPEYICGNLKHINTGRIQSAKEKEDKSKQMKNTISVFDIETLTFRRITKDEFNRYKGIRYFAPRSKEINKYILHKHENTIHLDSV